MHTTLANSTRGVPTEKITPPTLSVGYANGFFEYFRSGGERISAALEEASNVAGGFAVPSITDQQIFPLAPSDFAVRNLSTVIPTVCDRRIAVVTALATATAKTEGSAFGSSTGTIGQKTLSAYTVGVEQDASLEIFEDVPLFNETVLRDSETALQVCEEGKFLSGSGSSEPQGLLGNVGTGITGVLAGSDSYASELLTATFDVMGAVKSRYLSNSTFLMSRATAVVLRKAQVGSGLFEHVFTRENGQDLLHGYPIAYSDGMPSIAPGTTPVLFGNFRAAYLVGDRGGSAVSMKILDQANFLSGTITLLIFRRTDGRVRCPEAVQGITLHS